MVYLNFIGFKISFRSITVVSLIHKYPVMFFFFARLLFNTWEYTDEKACISRYNSKGNEGKKEGHKSINYLDSEHELDCINI